jgi:hypothetical protein
MQDVEAKQDGLPDSDDTHNEGTRPAKRQRNFIARQACEACRLKKTRCDEDVPCSLCRSLGIECNYAERKPTKNEISMSMVFNTLRRMETKLDGLSQPAIAKSGMDRSETHRRSSSLQQIESPLQVDSVASHHSISSPLSSTRQLHRQSTGAGQLVLSFSAHQSIHWPGVQAILPHNLASTVRSMEKSYPTHLESNRSVLSPTVSAQALSLTGDWLSSLSLSCVKDLSNAYFDTYNRVYPFIDRDFYFSSTLAVVVREGFGHDMESCLVLNVMALGCMGLKASEEGGFTTDQAPVTPLIRHIMDEEISGLSFFNESRRRVGVCLCERTIEACQYYLTSAIYYAQVMRPVDKWMMTNRAATICTSYWKCPPDPSDEWLSDMQSRLFWCSLMLESVIVQELELPPSGLKGWEDEVPLPKFTTYPYASNSRAQHADDSFYHYHFLAQIAQRIILNRIRDELFYSNPSTKLAEELRHQLEQWRANLPEALQYVDDRQGQNFSCPAEAVVVALLQMRYRVSIFHLGRSFLYKAIHNPASVSDMELKLCADALEYAMDWHMTLPVCASMKNFAPLKYFCCGQFFGQLLIFHAFKNSTDRRLRDALPSGYDAWCTKMLRFIYDFADTESNPTIAKDCELLSALYHVAADR